MMKEALRVSISVLSLSIATVAFAAKQPGKPDLAKGRQIATTVCAACHGADGNSTVPANPRLAEQIPAYIVKELHDFKGVHGKKPTRHNAIMNGMAATLSDADIRDVAAYFSSQTAKGDVARSAKLAHIGKKIFRAGDAATGLPACAGCHGPTGAGIPSQFPRLAGQHEEYIVSQLKAFHDGQRTNDTNRMMRAIAGKMSGDQMRAVADYIAGLR